MDERKENKQQYQECETRSAEEYLCIDACNKDCLKVCVGKKQSPTGRPAESGCKEAIA